MRSSAGLVLVTAWLMAAPLAAQPYNARTNYILHCQGCHGDTGISGTPTVVPPLLDSVGYFVRVPGGRAYLAQVPGASQAPIGDAELADLLTYMIRRFSAEQAGPDFEPYTEEEVRAVRRQRPDVVELRAQLVARIREALGVELWTDGYAMPGAAR